MARTRSNNTTNPFVTPVSNRRGRNAERAASTHSSMSIGSTHRRGESRRRSRSIVRFATKGALNERVPAVSKRGNSVKKEGKKKKIKVSVDFKKKVNAALEKNMIKGTYVETMYSFYALVDTNQGVATLGQSTSVGQFTLGDPVRILDAASVLWNSKTPILNKTATDIGNFSYEGFKCYVERCSTNYLIKNNTANTVTITLIDYSPKTIFGGVGFDFVGQWQNALALFGPPAAGTQSTTLNPLNNLVTELGLRPSFTPSMTKQYSMDYTTIVLEPGKEYMHKVPLYNDKMLDFSKYDQNGTFANQQKFVKGTVMIYKSDLTCGADNKVGRYTDIVTPSPYQIIVEQTNNYNLRMPEQAGFVYPNVAPVAGQNIALYKRARAFAFKNFGLAQGLAQAVINDENPAVPVTAGTA